MYSVESRYAMGNAASQCRRSADFFSGAIAQRRFFRNFTDHGVIFLKLRHRFEAFRSVHGDCNVSHCFIAIFPVQRFFREPSGFWRKPDRPFLAAHCIKFHYGSPVGIITFLKRRGNLFYQKNSRFQNKFPCAANALVCNIRIAAETFATESAVNHTRKAGIFLRFHTVLHGCQHIPFRLLAV